MSDEKGKERLVPALRFPEFQKAGQWKKSPLSEYVSSLDAGVSVVSGDRPAGPNEIGILKTSAVTDGVFNPAENKVVLNKAELHRVKESVAGNTLIISRMNTPALVGANAYVSDSMENIFLPDRLWAAKPRRNTSMRFLSFVLGSEKGRAALSELANGTSGSMKNITKPDVLALKIAAPLFAEQQKIAACLSSLDDLIAAQTRKIKALKAHKKGLMQQLFPAEGETVPHLRFSKFQNAGEWKVKKIKNILEKVSNPVDVQANDFYREIGIRSHGKGIFHKEMVSGTQLGDKRVFWAEENTLVLNIVFAWEQAVATVSKDEAGMIASHRFPMYRGKNKTSVEFVKHFLLTSKGKFLLGLASPGGAGRNRTLGQKYFESLEFHVPVDLGEQVMIADCLSSIDTLIFAHTKKLDILNTQKQGLIQALFPSANEVEI